MELNYNEPFSIKPNLQAFIGRWEFVFYGADRMDVFFGHSKVTTLKLNPKIDVIITSRGGEQIWFVGIERFVGIETNKYCVQKV